MSLNSLEKKLYNVKALKKSISCQTFQKFNIMSKLGQEKVVEPPASRLWLSVSFQFRASGKESHSQAGSTRKLSKAFHFSWSRLRPLQWWIKSAPIRPMRQHSAGANRPQLDANNLPCVHADAARVGRLVKIWGNANGEEGARVPRRGTLGTG